MEKLTEKNIRNIQKGLINGMLDIATEYGDLHEDDVDAALLSAQAHRAMADLCYAFMNAHEEDILNLHDRDLSFTGVGECLAECLSNRRSGFSERVYGETGRDLENEAHKMGAFRIQKNETSGELDCVALVPQIDAEDRRDFTQGFLEALFFARITDEDPFDGPERSVINDYTRERLVEQCEQFCDQNAMLLNRAFSCVGYSANQAGSDFALSRNGHGAGFFDRCEIGKASDLLQEAARKAGEAELYRGDDGQLYVMGLEPPRDDQIKDEPPKDFQAGFLEQLVQNAIEAGEPIDLEKDDLGRFSTHAIQGIIQICQGIIQICQDFVTDNLDTLNSAAQMNGGDHAGLGRMLANALTRKQPGFQTPELGDAGKELQRDAATLPDCKLAVDADGTVKLWQTQPSATGTKIRPGP